MSKKLAIAVVLASGLFMLKHYFFANDFTDTMYRTLLDYYQIIFAATLVVGGIGLLQRHLGKVASSHSARPFSAITIAAVLFMVVSALLFGTGDTSPYQWAFNNLQAPMQATTFSLLAFFVASAAFRGFRIRSAQALVLVIAAVIMLVGRNAFGEMISQQLPEAAVWLLNNPSAAAKRGLLIGVGLGSVVTALRVILGIERSYL